MKKGLSALLIAAALFGFYGGAVNLNDVLACKDYWEAEDERTTADLNKLEDGLNQLKENEQAYLDGLDALADGEEALAQGEADYAAGQKELAKGEADYAAAPGKLRAGEKKLAAGKEKLADGYAAYNKGQSDLAAGKEQLKGLAALINGMDTILNGYANDWKPGYEKLRDGRRQIAGGLKAVDGSAQDPVALAALLPSSLQGVFTSALNGIKNDADGQKASDFDAFISNCSTANQCFDAIKSAVQQKKPGVDALVAAMEANGADAVCAANKSGVLQLGESLSEETSPTKSTFEEQVNACVLLYTKQAQGEELTDNEKQQLAQSKAIVKGVADATKSKLDQADAALNSATFLGLKAGLQQMAANSSAPAELAAGQDKLAGGVQQIAAGVLSSDTLKDAVKEKMGASAITLLTAYKATPNPLNTEISDFGAFYGQMESTPGFVEILTKAKALMKAAQASGQATVDDGEKKLSAAKKQLAQGEKDLAAGKKELAKGYADYKAAPGKLANGRAQLAEGLQKLMDGRKELADGKEKLAEYEDGEQQVRDGLATLMASEANGGLQSILDRRSGDEDFDNGDEHLELDEGLDAVSVGREYKADSGELVTAEIMKRAIGTGLGLAAGALAVLAGLLSLLKKNKGAGVCAALTAIAGGAGIATGTSAGLEFSSIAGSAVGATPWIAFGVLAAVAAVHAIAHFAAKPEA